jgi:Leucine-rich repeat (LRR) protein
MTATSKPRRRWILYGLRTLVVLLFLACVARYWIAVKLLPVKRERAAAEAIELSGGAVTWTYPDSTGESRVRDWLKRILGDDYFARPDNVTVCSDAAMESLVHLRQVRRLYLGGTQVSDAGLEHLSDVTQLEVLSIAGTQVTDAGLAYLAGLTQLQELWLMDTPVTDAGLERLTGLTQLRELSFVGGEVTDIGLRHVSKLTTLSRLWVTGAQVTRAGLEHLKALTRLEQLYLTDMPVSDTDAVILRRAMPNCWIMVVRPDRETSIGFGKTTDEKGAVHLLLADAVQKDLNLTTDQMRTFTEFAEFSKKQLRALAGMWHTMSPSESEQVSEAPLQESEPLTMETATKSKELQATVMGMLTTSQRERLHQIQFQYAMAVALLQPSLIKELNISDEQLDQIRQHARTYVLAKPELMQGLEIPDEEIERIYPASGALSEDANAKLHAFDGLSPTEILRKMLETAKNLDATLGEANRLALDVLSPEQRVALKKFVGEQIELSWDYDALMPTD